MTAELFARATIITPNRFQAAILADLDECLGQDAMEEAGHVIFKRYGCPVVISGGGVGECRDVFVGLDGLSHFSGTGGGRTKVHGRGSTFSAALTAGLANGESLRESILNAKLYVAHAMAAASNFPVGYAPLWHGVTPFAATVE
jgi:hydroxymethylpyrimidine/phosphomethylpyrimidine kinase